MDDNIIYFELDNWFAGRDYPNAEPFLTWMRDDLNLKFADDNWCKENKLCVIGGVIDMSVCFCIAALRSWVEENCPKLLTNEECGDTYKIHYFNKELNKPVEEERYEPCSYSKFICEPDENGEIIGRISGWTFPEYCEENFGITWYYGEEYDEEQEDE